MPKRSRLGPLSTEDISQHPRYNRQIKFMRPSTSSNKLNAVPYLPFVMHSAIF